MALDFQRAQTNVVPARCKAEAASLQVCSAFRAQPIVHAGTFEVQGIEMLSRVRMRFDDPKAMLEADIQAVQAAAVMASTQAYDHVHCNAEVLSMIKPEWLEAMAFCITPGMVIEIVERNSILMSPLIMGQMRNVVMLIRQLGGKVALDDVRFNDHNIHIIEQIQPEIIKVEHEAYVPCIRGVSDAPIVVERIETRELADKASLVGTDYLQGYYCDVAVQDAIPSRLTPPGVMAMRNHAAMDRELKALPLDPLIQAEPALYA